MGEKRFSGFPSVLFVLLGVEGDIQQVSRCSVV
jgi:hypothetical protein